MKYTCLSYVIKYTQFMYICTQAWMLKHKHVLGCPTSTHKNGNGWKYKNLQTISKGRNYFIFCLFLNFTVPLGFLPFEIPVAFPGESQLPQSCHKTCSARCFNLKKKCFHSRIFDMEYIYTDSLTCVFDLSAYAYMYTHKGTSVYRLIWRTFFWGTDFCLYGNLPKASEQSLA